MSHIVTVETEIRDALSLGAACRRLDLPQPAHETAQLFSGAATGYCVQLPGWRYPLVCHLETGQLSFDNYRGRWGDQRHLNHLIQAYAVEKTRLEAGRSGHTVVEQTLEDGSIKMTVQAGGVA